jgi:hypothetical protein
MLAATANELAVARKSRREKADMAFLPEFI